MDGLLTNQTRRRLACVAYLCGAFVWGLGVQAVAQSTKPAESGKSTPRPEIVQLKPGYSLTDKDRDPFYPDAQPAKKSGPGVDELAATLKINGLTGTAEDPESARLLIDSKIYKINDSIPVLYKGTPYNLVLVQVKFPGKVVLKYNDTSTVVDVNPKSKGVSP